MKKELQKDNNIFINLLYEKINNTGFFKKIIHKRKVNKFICKFIKSSPDFSMLWYISDLIKIAEDVYFYNNTPDSALYSSVHYKSGENGFRLNTNKYTLTVKLYADYSKKVVLEINRKGSHCTNSEFVFFNNKWNKEHSIVDEIMLESIIESINHEVIKLFRFCYNE